MKKMVAILMVLMFAASSMFAATFEADASASVTVDVFNNDPYDGEMNFTLPAVTGDGNQYDGDGNYVPAFRASLSGASDDGKLSASATVDAGTSGVSVSDYGVTYKIVGGYLQYYFGNASTGFKGSYAPMVIDYEVMFSGDGTGGDGFVIAPKVTWADYYVADGLVKFWAEASAPITLTGYLTEDTDSGDMAMTVDPYAKFYLNVFFNKFAEDLLSTGEFYVGLDQWSMSGIATDPDVSAMADTTIKQGIKIGLDKTIVDMFGVYFEYWGYEVLPTSEASEDMKLNMGFKPSLDLYFGGHNIYFDFETWGNEEALDNDVETDGTPFFASFKFNTGVALAVADGLTVTPNFEYGAWTFMPSGDDAPGWMNLKISASYDIPKFSISDAKAEEETESGVAQEDFDALVEKVAEIDSAVPTLEERMTVVEESVYSAEAPAAEEVPVEEE